MGCDRGSLVVESSMDVWLQMSMVILNRFPVRSFPPAGTGLFLTYINASRWDLNQEWYLRAVPQSLLRCEPPDNAPMEWNRLRFVVAWTVSTQMIYNFETASNVDSTKEAM